MFDADQVLKQHNVNLDSVAKWAKQTYPAWEPQGQAVKKAYCYLVLKYHPPPMYRPRGEPIPLSKLEIGDSADTQFTVLGLVEERSYMGCPKGHSLRGKTVGETALCEDCAQMVTTESIIIRVYEITDGKETHLPATSFRDTLPEGATITANVTVRPDGSIGIWRYKVDEQAKVTNDGIALKPSEERGVLAEPNLSNDGSKSEEVEYLTCPACATKLKPMDWYSHKDHRISSLMNHILHKCTKKEEALAIMKEKRYP